MKLNENVSTFPTLCKSIHIYHGSIIIVPLVEALACAYSFFLSRLHSSDATDQNNPYPSTDSILRVERKLLREQHMMSMYYRTLLEIPREK